MKKNKRISSQNRYGEKEESLSGEYLDNAEFSWNKGDRMRAVDLAREAWNIHPYEKDIFAEIRSQLNEEYPDLENTKAELKTKIASLPDRGMSCTEVSVGLFRQLSRILASGGEWDEAETYCLYAIGFSNNCMEAAQLCNFLGLIYLNKGELENACQRFVSPGTMTRRIGVYIFIRPLFFLGRGSC